MSVDGRDRSPLLLLLLLQRNNKRWFRGHRQLATTLSFTDRSYHGDMQTDFCRPTSCQVRRQRSVGFSRPSSTLPPAAVCMVPLGCGVRRANCVKACPIKTTHGIVKVRDQPTITHESVPAGRACTTTTHGARARAFDGLPQRRESSDHLNDRPSFMSTLQAAK